MRAFLLTLAACGLLVAGCGSGRDEAAVAPTEPSTSGVETTVAGAGVDRSPAPPIEGISLDGEPLSLAELAGRSVLINVWSSW